VEGQCGLMASDTGRQDLPTRTALEWREERQAPVVAARHCDSPEIMMYFRSVPAASCSKLDCPASTSGCRQQQGQAAGECVGHG